LFLASSNFIQKEAIIKCGQLKAKLEQTS